MNSAVLAVVAALGASLLTGLASLGVTWFREWLHARATAREALTAAVTAMLSRSMAVMMRAQAIGLQMRLRSGFGEGADVMLRLRKPFDVLEFHAWMAADLDPLNEAWSVIWARGDQEIVRLANKLLGKCSDLMDSATARYPAATVAERARRAVAGERWTPEMQADLGGAVKEVARARRDLALCVRRKHGIGDAELFGYAPPAPPDISDAPDGQPPAQDALPDPT